MGTGKKRKVGGHFTLRQTRMCDECGKLYFPSRRYPYMCADCSRGKRRGDKR